VAREVIVEKAKTLPRVVVHKEDRAFWNDIVYDQRNADIRTEYFKHAV
jgi:hypothetical protein